MTAEEMIEIKHRISLETARMTVAERNAYYSKGAAEIQEKIDKLRAENEVQNAMTTNAE